MAHKQWKPFHCDNVAKSLIYTMSFLWKRQLTFNATDTHFIISSSGPGTLQSVEHHTGLAHHL